MATVLEPELTAHVGDIAIAASAQIDLDFGLSLNEGILVLGVEMDMSMLRGAAEASGWAMALSTDPAAAALAWDTASIFELRSDVMASLLLGSSFFTDVGDEGLNAHSVKVFGNGDDRGYLIARNLRLLVDEFDGAAGGLTFNCQVRYKRVRLTDSEIAGAIVTRGR